MPSVPLPIASYNQPSRAPARLVNCYAQSTIGKTPVELVGAPGVVAFAQVGSGPGRGLFVMRGSLYAVSGDGFYRISDAGVVTRLGTLPGSGKLTFAGNGSEIVFDNRYIYTSGQVSAITDPDLPALTAVDFVDGYVVYAESGTGRWGASELYNGASYPPLNFATAEAHPDDIVTLKVDHRQVILFGQETTEIWWNEGLDAFPFSRLSGGVLEYGALARLGVAQQDNSVFWLAHDRTFRRLSEQTPVRISNHAIEEKLSGYSRVDDCEAFPFTWNGHLFVVFRFPEAGACWVYDCTTNEWHERQTWGSSTWNMVDAAECHGRVYVQSASTGVIGYLSDTNYTEFGQLLRREWTYPQVYDTNRRVYHTRLQLVARTGGAPIGQVPNVLLEVSNDGGNTWMSMPAKELGRTGEYAHRIAWHRLGQSRDRVYRMSLDNTTVPLTVLDTTLDYL